MSAKTTYQRSAKGPVTISECSADGKYIAIENTGRRVRTTPPSPDCLIYHPLPTCNISMTIVFVCYRARTSATGRSRGTLTARTGNPPSPSAALSACAHLANARYRISPNAISLHKSFVVRVYFTHWYVHIAYSVQPLVTNTHCGVFSVPDLGWCQTCRCRPQRHWSRQYWFLGNWRQHHHKAGQCWWRGTQAILCHLFSRMTQLLSCPGLFLLSPVHFLCDSSLAHSKHAASKQACHSSNYYGFSSFHFFCIMKQLVHLCLCVCSPWLTSRCRHNLFESTWRKQVKNISLENLAWNSSVNQDLTVHSAERSWDDKLKEGYLLMLLLCCVYVTVSEQLFMVEAEDHCLCHFFA